MPDLPFSRGLNAMDGAVACALQYSVDYAGVDATRQVAAVLGPASVLDSPSPNSLVPPVRLVVFADLVLVVFGSTQNFQQWVGNVLGSVQGPAPGIPGSVSRYFAQVAAVQFAIISDALHQLAATRRVCFIGFSLGAATALLCRQLFGGPATVWALGPPRVGDPAWALAYPSADVIGVGYDGDGVPSLPPVLWAGSGVYQGAIPIPPLVTYAHPVAGATLFADGHTESGFQSQALSDVLVWLSIGAWRQSHYMPVYASAFRRTIPASLYPGYDGYSDAQLFDLAATATWPNYYWPWQPNTLPAAHEVVDMAAICTQFTMMFRNRSGPPLGWSEVWYMTQTTAQGCENAWTGASIKGTNLLALRQAILSSSCEIFAYRSAVVRGDPMDAKSSLLKRPVPSIQGVVPTTEISPVALVFLGSTNVSKRQAFLRGISDTWANDNGLTTAGQSVVNQIKATGALGGAPGYLSQVVLAGGCILSDDLNNKYQLTGATQTAGGPVTLTYDPRSSGIVYQAGDLVIIGACKGFPLLNGTWQVQGTSASGSVVLGGTQWLSVPTKLVGTIRIATKSPNTSPIVWDFIGVRKRDTGRPSLLQRGRRSARIHHR